MLRLAVIAVAWLLSCGDAFAAESVTEEAETELSILTLVAGLLIAAVHLFGEAVHRVLFRNERVARSFGSGMAVAYLFLQLMPELMRGVAHHGHWILTLALLGFLLFYGLAKLASATTDRHQGKRGMFMLNLGFMTLYSWMIVYSLPDVVKLSGRLPAAIVCVALAIHMLSSVHGMAEQHEGLFRIHHRLLLAAAALLGAVMDMVVEPDPLISSISVALVTGFIMFGTLNEELPDPARSDYKMFALGVATVAGLSELALHL